MDHIRNLVSQEAVEKLRELVECAPTCMFGTNLSVIPMHVCPMHVMDVDGDGSLWFFTGLNTEHSAQILEDPRVQLIFNNASKYEFLTVFGEAELLRDVEKIHELWKPMVKAWFPDGKDDPNLTMIRVDPKKVHYWDTKDGKLVVLAKILYGAVTGKIEEGGVQGDLKV
jgi:general stress protein 26